MEIRPTANDAAAVAGRGAWYRQGIVWLAAAVFAASIAGCIWLIILAERYTDEPVPVTGPHVMTVPVAQPPAAAPRRSP